MKFTSIISTIALTSLHTALAVQLAYDTGYDNRKQSLATVACSDGANGLLTRGFTTFDSLPSFPRIGAASAIEGWNSTSCGTCWELTYTNAQGAKKAINITAIDVASPGFNIALAAMNTLTNGQAVQFGRVDVASRQVPASGCGL